MPIRSSIYGSNLFYIVVDLPLQCKVNKPTMVHPSAYPSLNN